MAFLDEPGLGRVLNGIKAKFIKSPSTAGTAGQILRSDGNGGVTWGSAASQSEISTAVTNWLDANVPTGGQTIAIDKSLSVSNAAADSKTVGDLKADKTDTVLLTHLSRGRKANTSIGTNSFAFGDDVTASGGYSHAEGHETNALSSGAHAEGDTTTASGSYSHAEGSNTIASAQFAHAEGHFASASQQCSHAEGFSTSASGIRAHAEGEMATASGTSSHAEGGNTTASGNYSHAEGCYTISNHKSQHVVGEYNIGDTSTASAGSRGNFVEIVGNGDSNARSNARVLDWNGNERIAGEMYINCDYDSSGGTAVGANLSALASKIDGILAAVGLVYYNNMLYVDPDQA